MINPLFPFSLEEATKTNTLITGANASGKTLLACNIASLLKRVGQVVVIDNVGVWKQKSDIPFYYSVSYRNCPYPLFRNESIIYDTSRLRSTEQKLFVDTVTLELWNRQLENNSVRTWLILEEGQLYLRNIRGQVAEDILRVMSAGRNHKIRSIVISPDLALIDPAIIRLCGQRYHGRLSIEENSKRKFRAYYGKDWQYSATHDLETGLFLHVVNDTLKIVKIPEFKSKQKSVEYIPQPKRQVFIDPYQPKKRKSWLKQLLGY